MNIVIIGASSGGPAALNRVFDGLPVLRAAMIVVQHMPKFINASFTDRLKRDCRLEFGLAKNGDKVREGAGFVAPSEVHLQFEDNRMLTLKTGQKVNNVCPAIDTTMLSLKKRADDFIVGVVLTGMGRDGAAGISHIKKSGGLTLAQDPESCAVNFMPKAAIATGQVDFVLPPEAIAAKLRELFG